jgi:phosphoribosylformylglycinamidine synthase
MALLYWLGADASREIKHHYGVESSTEDSLALIAGAKARYCYWVWLHEELSDHAILKDQLSSILPEVESHAFEQSITDHAFWVLPRKGILSPWASKAFDIIKNCGMVEVERIERGVYFSLPHHIPDDLSDFHDPLVESVLFDTRSLIDHFDLSEPSASVQTIPLLTQGRDVIESINTQQGLALSTPEIDYLVSLYQRLQRDPTDVELMMFAQVNSEHCRHKIFNAQWDIEKKSQALSLFDLIRTTYKANPNQVCVAYDDNAAVMHAHENVELFAIDPIKKVYVSKNESLKTVFKVETHNHPTAISPCPGAATGSGGEIRDESATGRGAKPKAGLCGFSVSQLSLPGLPQPWEVALPLHPGVASGLRIMIEGPVGAAAFNNEFGRPNILGYFRTLLSAVESESGTEYWGYHKPIMIAGGVGAIRESAVYKQAIPAETPLVVLGGPAFAIGLGGGAASSRANQADNKTLDFASVQRANPEMQRRCQEVINACWMLDEENPILSIHDVGAGGLSNALPELVAVSGGDISLEAIPCADQTLSPLEIWCNESQERYVLAIDRSRLAVFQTLCQRERCPFAVLGHADDSGCFQLTSKDFEQPLVDLACSDLLEKMPRMQRESALPVNLSDCFRETDIQLTDAVRQVLQLPAVAGKRFLVHIADRTVGGLTAQDQCVGPWQTPVSNVGVTLADYVGFRGEAMSMGERAPLAMIDAAASARMAVGEAITNLLSAPINSLDQVVFSANWMAAPNYAQQGAALYQAVSAITEDFCTQLGIAIPVGKDSLSMRSQWKHEDEEFEVMSPVSLVVSALAPLDDVRLTITPQLVVDESTRCLLIDLGQGQQAMAGSALAQVTSQVGQVSPDVRSVESLKLFVTAMAELKSKGLVLAYHDRSDGGLLTTLCEMMFAAHCGLAVDISSLPGSVLTRLFNEELGAVIQVKQQELEAVWKCLQNHGLDHCSHEIAQIHARDELTISDKGQVVYSQLRTTLQCWWAETSFRIQALRDDPECAKQEFDNLLDADDPGLNFNIPFRLEESPFIATQQPKVAILREQGVNGHVEMAQAFAAVGFEPHDVHMSDLLAGQGLDEFIGLVACGGFSYGDVLGAGRGWAQIILSNARLKDEFTRFFSRSETFTLGVCNGCQMLSHLQSLIPGANWPLFTQNKSRQFESRLVLAHIESSPSIFFQEMQDSVLPIVVAHGEGRVVGPVGPDNVVLRYVDHYHRVTERFPFNPNASYKGVNGFCSDDGRVTIMMPHPERVFRRVQYSWCAPDVPISPWRHFFANAARWCN